MNGVWFSLTFERLWMVDIAAGEYGASNKLLAFSQGTKTSVSQ
jgi:hypothetical protein